MIEPTDKQIHDACMSFNHEYDLLTLEVQGYIQKASLEWYKVWRNMVNKNDKCHGWFGKIFGHKYEHVYNTTMPYDIKGNLNSHQLELILKQQNKTYIFSICKRCGHMIEVKQG